MNRHALGLIISVFAFGIFAIIFIFTSNLSERFHLPVTSIFHDSHSGGSSSIGSSSGTNSDLHPELYSIAYTITYSSGEAARMSQDLDALMKQQATASTGVTIESRASMVKRIIQISDLYESLGQTGRAIEILEENFAGNVDQDYTYNYRLASLYEKVKAYNLALARYQFLITDTKFGDEKNIGDYTFLQKIANIYYTEGDRARGDEAMRAYDAYDKLIKNENTSSGLTKT